MARIINHKEATRRLNRLEKNLNSTALVNKDTLKHENKIIIAYSLKKIKTKPVAAYSTLKPETNSDSPSEKSKGVRLVSAKSRISHKPPKVGQSLISI